ncbi:MAG: glycoside hydrolase family 65 protein, partial [Clostridiales bacterium]|nr:glycoside hydrolase family 65 protein [Clostridiales bacterium]
MNYSKVSNWVLQEDAFAPQKLGKTEAIMSLGNGYMGVRSATEERYLRETRGVFVAGTFNKFDENEVTELPNAADMTAIELTVDGEPFDLTAGQVENYCKELNIRTGELKRSVVWTSPAGKKISYASYRVVSLKNLHQMAQRIEVTPLNGDVTVKIRSGINGTMTNTGSQHFSEGDKRFYDKRFIQFVQKTTQSGISFVNTTVHKLTVGGQVQNEDAQVYIERREIFAGYEVSVQKGALLEIEKYSNLATTRDFDSQGKSTEDLQKEGLAACKEMEAVGYAKIWAESAAQWEKEVWNSVPITIQGGEQAALDEFAIHFAQYHMRIMVPAHDSRMNIGAKGLSGEGYKGHCFWDTEIFLLPYYCFTAPETARRLEEYRYLSLPGAHAKAAHNG